MYTNIRVIHEGIRASVACPFCDLAFACRQGLEKHISRAHSTDDRYRCKERGRRFGDAAELGKRTGSHDVPRLECGCCRAPFKTRLSLAAHERGHRGERPHVCGVCGRGFALPGALLTHAKRAHKTLTGRTKPSVKRLRIRNE